MKQLRRLVMAAALSTLVGTLGMASTAALADDAHSLVGPKSAVSMQAIESASSIVEGAQGKDVKNTIYVFMDPNCIYCHFTWKALQAYEANGLQVHWIPIGFLKPDSAGKAAALLQASDGGTLLKQLENGYSVKTESGGIAPLESINPQTQTKLAANLKLFDTGGFEGTPTLIYRDDHGKWVDMDGMPKLGDLGTLLHLAKQPMTDKSLAQYY